MPTILFQGVSNQNKNWKETFSEDCFICELPKSFVFVYQLVCSWYLCDRIFLEFGIIVGMAITQAGFINQKWRSLEPDQLGTIQCPEFIVSHIVWWKLTGLLKIIWLTQTEVPLAWFWKLERLDLLPQCFSKFWKQLLHSYFLYPSQNKGFFHVTS